MASDIKTMSRKELEKLKGQIDKQLAKIDTQDKKAALIAAEKAAKQHGFSLSDLTGAVAPAQPAAKATRAKKTAAKGPVNPPKYRNPQNPDQTWTGKGRRPEWIKAAQDKGIDIETMAA